MSVLRLKAEQVAIAWALSQWTTAHSPAALIAASTNHAPQLAPLRKSPIAALPLHSQRPPPTRVHFVQCGTASTYVGCGCDSMVVIRCKLGSAVAVLAPKRAAYTCKLSITRWT